MQTTVHPCVTDLILCKCRVMKYVNLSYCVACMLNLGMQGGLWLTIQSSVQTVSKPVCKTPQFYIFEFEPGSGLFNVFSVVYLQHNCRTDRIKWWHLCFLSDQCGIWDTQSDLLDQVSFLSLSNIETPTVHPVLLIQGWFQSNCSPSLHTKQQEKLKSITSSFRKQKYSRAL